MSGCDDTSTDSSKPSEGRGRGSFGVPGFLILLIGTVLLGGCELSNEETEPEEEEPVRTLYRFFFVQGTSLEQDATDIPLNQPITLFFNQYLDRRAFAYHNALSLSSGGIWASGFSRYSMTNRSLTYYPTRNLQPNLIYELSVNDETVMGLGGVELTYPFTLRFETTAEGTVEQENRFPAALSYEADVAPLLEAGCPCHFEDDSLTALTPAAMNGMEAEGFTGRQLVHPFEPAHSYLMHKILWDYPDRRLTGMPPHWAGFSPLDLDQIEQIELWIATGARD